MPRPTRYDEPMQYCSFMLPKGLLVLVKAAAEAEGVTLSELVRELLFNYLEGYCVK